MIKHFYSILILAALVVITISSVYPSDSNSNQVQFWIAEWPHYHQAAFSVKHDSNHRESMGFPFESLLVSEWRENGWQYYPHWFLEGLEKITSIWDSYNENVTFVVPGDAALWLNGMGVAYPGVAEYHFFTVPDNAKVLRVEANVPKDLCLSLYPPTGSVVEGLNSLETKVEGRTGEWKLRILCESQKPTVYNIGAKYLDNSWKGIESGNSELWKRLLNYDVVPETDYHIAMTLFDEAAQRERVERAKVLHDLVGNPNPKGIIFPQGRFDKQSIDAIAASGFEWFTTGAFGSSVETTRGYAYPTHIDGETFDLVAFEVGSVGYDSFDSDTFERRFEAGELITLNIHPCWAVFKETYDDLEAAIKSAKRHNVWIASHSSLNDFIRAREHTSVNVIRNDGENLTLEFVNTDSTHDALGLTVRFSRDIGISNFSATTNASFKNDSFAVDVPSNGSSIVTFRHELDTSEFVLVEAPKRTFVNYKKYVLPAIVFSLYLFLFVKRRPRITRWHFDRSIFKSYGILAAYSLGWGGAVSYACLLEVDLMGILLGAAFLWAVWLLTTSFIDFTSWLLAGKSNLMRMQKIGIRAALFLFISAVPLSLFMYLFFHLRALPSAFIDFTYLVFGTLYLSSLGRGMKKGLEIDTVKILVIIPLSLLLIFALGSILGIFQWLKWLHHISFL